MQNGLHIIMHLTNGMTHSCYRPITHKIDLEELADNPLHYIIQKKRKNNVGRC